MPVGRSLFTNRFCAFISLVPALDDALTRNKNRCGKIFNAKDMLVVAQFKLSHYRHALAMPTEALEQSRSISALFQRANARTIL